MTLSPTPNMALNKPEPGVTAGTLWAQMLNTLTDALDQHDHSPGKGARITPAGLNINADVNFGQNNAALLRSAGFFDQPSILGVSEVDKVYFKSGDLWINNSAGAAVQVTSGTGVNSSVSGAFAVKTPGAYPYTVVSGDAQRVLLVDTTAAHTINLPAATTAILFMVKDISGSSFANKITVAPNGGDKIDGVVASKTLARPFGMWVFISDGVNNWSIGTMSDSIGPQSYGMVLTGNGGTLGIGTNTVNYSYYEIEGKKVTVPFYATTVVTGTAGTFLTVSLPLASATLGSPAAAQTGGDLVLQDSGGLGTGQNTGGIWVIASGASVAQIYKPDGSNWTAGAARLLSGRIVYQAA